MRNLLSEAEIHLPGRIHKGDRVFKTYDARMMEEASSIYENVSWDLKVDFTVKALLGQALEISATDSRGIKAKVVANYIAFDGCS